MTPTVKKLTIYLPATALGLWAAWLQNGILSRGFDEKGLLIGENPDLLLVWALTAVYALGALVLTLGLGANGTYEQNFPRCAMSGGVMITAGVLMIFSGVNQLVPGLMARAALTIAAGVLMAVCGGFRLLGRKPLFLLDFAIGLYYAAHLLWCYSGWNADPHLQRYAFQLLAGVCVMLFTLHRGRCAVGVMERKKMVCFGILGIFFCFAAIPGSDGLLFYLASGLWCAGAMGDLSRFQKEETP